MSEVKNTLSTGAYSFRRMVTLVALVGVLAISAAMWLGLSSLYDHALTWLIKTPSASVYGSVNLMTLFIAFAWSIGLLALSCFAIYARPVRVVVFLIGSVALVLIAGVLTHLSALAFFAVSGVPRWVHLYVVLAILAAQPPLIFALTKTCFHALKELPAPERQAMTMMIGFAGLMFALAVILALAPGVEISNRRFFGI